MMRVRPGPGPLAVVALLGCIGLAAAAEDLNAALENAVASFEERAAKDFVPVARSLDQWRERRRGAALKELTDLLTKATGEDKIYLAYHLLAANPRHKTAREVFTKLGVAAPVDANGVAAAGWTPPACRNPELLDKVSASAYPPFAVVAEAVYAPNVKAYSRRAGEQLAAFKTTLIGLAGSAPDRAAVIYPIVGYYHPEAAEVRAYFAAKGKPVPRQRIWFNPLDRWLLDHELAGIDCLDARMKPSSGTPPALTKGEPARLHGSATWDFPEYLRGCRIEGVLSTPGGATIALSDDQGRGATLALAPTQLTLSLNGAKEPLGSFPLAIDLAVRPSPIQLEARGRELTVRVGGLVIGSGTLPERIAFKRATIAGPLVASQLRVRYLADRPEPADVTVAAKPTEPAEPAWMEARRKDLDRRVTFEFTDTPMEEVVAMLGRLTGAAFTLDDSASTLSSLPISLTGNDMPVKTAIEWIARFSGLEAKPGETGFTFTWSGK